MKDQQLFLQAQTADFTISDLAFLSVSPSPIGVGQQALVNMWITFPSGEGKYMTGYKVVITDPSGHSRRSQPEIIRSRRHQLVPIHSRPSRYIHSSSCSLQASTSQQATTATENTQPPVQATFANAIYNPSVYCTPAESNIVNLTVQQDMVMSWSITNANRLLDTPNSTKQP